MDYNTDIEVKEAYEKISQIPKSTCNCQRGVAMCKKVPCMGTVENMEKIMDAGYSKNLMLEWWSGTGSTLKHGFTKYGNPFTEDVMYLCPAVIGYEGKVAPFKRGGTCNLLKDDLCSIHSIKPVQGQIACCQFDYKYLPGKEESDENMINDERHDILITWNTEKGKALIERWKKEVGLEEIERQQMPESIEEIFDLLLQNMDEILGNMGKVPPEIGQRTIIS